MSNAPAAKPFNFVEFVKPFLAPYYLTIAGVLGLVTTIFVVVITLLIIVACNFNFLGFVE